MPLSFPATSGIHSLAPLLPLDPGTPPGGVEWAAANAYDALGYSVQAQSRTAYLNWLDRPADPLFRLVFTTGTGGNFSTTSQAYGNWEDFMSGSYATGTDTLIVSTQLVFGTTQSLQTAATTTANRAHWMAVGALLHSSGFDTRWPDGRPKRVVRAGWEGNGSWYTWATNRASTATGGGGTPAQRAVWYRQAQQRAFDDMADGGCNMDNVGWAINYANGWGTTADNTAMLPDCATAVTCDFYDTGFQYEQAWTASNKTAADIAARKALRRAEVWNSKLTSGGGINFCRDLAADRGLVLGSDEWGCSGWSNNTGGDDNPDFIQNVYDYFTAAASIVDLGWLCYFERDTSDGGSSNPHRLEPSERAFPFVSASARFLARFGG